MDIQTKKLHFVQEFLRVTDEKIIDKLNYLLHSERRKKTDKYSDPLGEKEFNEIIDKAESDAKNSRLTSAKELNNEIDSWT